jgi:hypothetical protein
VDHDALQLRGIYRGKMFEQAAVGDQQARARVAHHMLQQVSLVSGIDRHVHRAEPVQCQPHEHGERAIRQPAQHVVVLIDAERLQAGSMAPHGQQQRGGGIAFTRVEAQQHQAGIMACVILEQVACDAQRGEFGQGELGRGELGHRRDAAKFIGSGPISL